MRAPDRVLHVLRWTAVLPGALIGAGLLQLVLVVAYTWLVTRLLGGYDAEGLARRLAMRTVVNVVFGGGAVVLARAIAPSHKDASAAGMAALLAVVSIVVWMAQLDVGAAWDRYATVVSVAAALVTATAALSARRV
ncbi:MAG TPA: hypothetical protein VGK30_00690 [Candidatus Binatia bacterium]|jgi:hypothetical protein